MMLSSKLSKLVAVAKSILGRMGYKIIRSNLDEYAPFEDMQRFVDPTVRPVIFDVGANTGQTVSKIRHYFPGASVYAFEPSPSTFEILNQNCSGLPGVSLWNLGIGSTEAVMMLNECNHSIVSSFLEPGELGDTVKARTPVNVVSLDHFMEANSIARIDILKIDAQGFELEVFKGAASMMEQHRIGMIFFEMTISGLYENLPPYYELLRFLDERGFVMASLYDPHYTEERRYKTEIVRWTNMLYIDKSYFEAYHSI